MRGKGERGRARPPVLRSAMSVCGEEDFGEEDRGPRRNRESLALVAFAAAGRALEREADGWFVWIPVLFAAGIIAYFALQNEPDPRIAFALVLGALGLCPCPASQLGE